MGCWADFAKFIKSPMFKKIADIGLKKGTATGSVQNDGSVAISSFTTALGEKSTAGTMAFKVISISGNNITLDSTSGLAVGMTCSAQITNAYNSFGKITSISGNTITVDTVPSGYEIDGDSVLWIPTNPNLGTQRVGDSSMSVGCGNKANQAGSFANGYNNIADGKYSLVSGRNNYASYGCTAFGQANKALGFFSLTNGDNNTVHPSGNNSMANGAYNNVLGVNSFASGFGNFATTENSFVTGEGCAAGQKNTFAGGYQSQTYNRGCFVYGNNLLTNQVFQSIFGEYNNTNGSAYFMVGNGSSGSDRKNAFEVLRDGRATVGANPINNMDVATKQYVDGRVANAGNITSGTLNSNRLPTVPISRGGTNATTAEGARSNLGVSRVRCTHVNFTVRANDYTEVSFTADADVVGYTVSLAGLSSTAGSYESMNPSLIDKVSVAGIYKSNSTDKKKTLAYIKSTHSATLYGQVCIMYVTA